MGRWVVWMKERVDLVIAWPDLALIDTSPISWHSDQSQDDRLLAQ